MLARACGESTARGLQNTDLSTLNLVKPQVKALVFLDYVTKDHCHEPCLVYG